MTNAIFVLDFTYWIDLTTWRSLSFSDTVSLALTVKAHQVSGILDITLCPVSKGFAIPSHSTSRQRLQSSITVALLASILHMSKADVQTSQPLNLALPSKTKAKMAARAAIQEAQARMNGHPQNCRCPQIDSKSSILYRLLTGTNSYPSTDLHESCHSLSGRCGCGSPTRQMESKLKLLLEESKKAEQIVQVQ